MFWVEFARSDLRAGARTEKARSWFSGKPIRCNEKPRAREVRKSRWTQNASTPPLTTTILGNCFLDGISQDLPLRGMQHRGAAPMQGFGAGKTPAGAKTASIFGPGVFFDAGQQDFLGTFFSFTENKWPDLKGGVWFAEL